MTQYSFLITFYECELEMLQKAFTHYLELCKQGIKKNDEYAHFVFDSVMIKRLRSELRKKTGRSPRVSVDEGEESALEAALASYLEVCEREIANGARAPFADEKDMIELIREAMKIESRRGAIDFDLWQKRMDSKLKRKE
jgi:hypothetical protein